MSDNTHIRQPQDPTTINLHQTWEVEYWCKKFGVSETSLRKAVAAVGKSVAAVRRHLGK